jgi:hypothetical protein
MLLPVNHKSPASNEVIVEIFLKEELSTSGNCMVLAEDISAKEFKHEGDTRAHEVLKYHTGHVQFSTEQVPHAFNKITLTIREDLVIPIAGKILARITLGTKFEIHIYYEICNCTTKSIVYPYYFDTVSRIVWKYAIIMDNQK